MSAPSPDPTRGPRSTLSIAAELIDDETVVLMLSGEADLWSAPELKRTLYDMLAAERRRVVLDLAGVRFMDSTALGVLVAIDRRLAGDQRLALAEPSAEVLRLFELTGVAAGFQIFSTRTAAVRHLIAGHAEPVVSVPAPPLTADAALLLGIAATAMPFAQSLEEQAERWLSALRRHGEAGAVLASLGVQEAPVSRLGDARGTELPRPADTDAVAIVTDRAGHVAAERGAPKLSTSHVLRAVVHVYGETFERVLAAHGVSVDELLERLENGEPAGAERQSSR